MAAARKISARIESSRRPCPTLSTLYHQKIPKGDKRLANVLERSDFRALQERLAANRETVMVDDSQIYHLDGITGILFPVATPLSAPATKFAMYRLHRGEGGPQALLFEFHGAVGRGPMTNGEGLHSVTVSSASGKNRITFRPEARFGDIRDRIIILDLELVDDEEDDGFWDSIGDFFGGIVDAISDFFDEVWEWLKKIGKEIWEEVKAGLAKIFVTDEDGDGVPDAFWVQKEFRF
ncbi:MAG: hypothetical protein IH926_11345 [Proteobacteria bacterium]|nr:hypothetical protein [Pseudomonadota bacterium]